MIKEVCPIDQLHSATASHQKGKRIDQFSAQAIAVLETWCNSLPRKTFGYISADELFEAKPDKIYQLNAT